MPRKIITAPSDIENALFAEGFSVIAGVDEVGRGPLAGPVVACALILPQGVIIEGVRDSKKINPHAKREALAEKIRQAAISFAFGIIEPDEIDRINILQATIKAMSIAVNGLSQSPDAVLIDGSPVTLHGYSGATRCVKGGDALSHLIAAASILAKVKRDTIMKALHADFPMYAWENNAGYGTPEHMAAIAAHGLSPHHRRSFCGRFL